MGFLDKLFGIEAVTRPFSMSGERYTDRSYGFSIGLPAGWRQQEMDERFRRNGGVIAIESPGGKASFNLSRGSPGSYAATWREHVLATFSAFRAQARNPSETSVTSGQLAGEGELIRTEFEVYRQGGPPGRVGKVCVLRNGVEYVIYYFARSDSDADFDAILDSWRWERK